MAVDTQPESGSEKLDWASVEVTEERMEKTRSGESQKISEPTSKETTASDHDNGTTSTFSTSGKAGAAVCADNPEKSASAGEDEGEVEELTGDEALECGWQISWDQGANKANKQGNNYCNCLQSLGTFRTVGEFVECWE
jgi:hypothetical protein